jgi:hypothetical protein
MYLSDLRQTLVNPPNTTFYESVFSVYTVVRLRAHSEKERHGEASRRIFAHFVAERAEK